MTRQVFEVCDLQETLTQKIEYAQTPAPLYGLYFSATSRVQCAVRAQPQARGVPLPAWAVGWPVGQCQCRRTGPPRRTVRATPPALTTLLFWQPLPLRFAYMWRSTPLELRCARASRNRPAAVRRRQHEHQ